VMVFERRRVSSTLTGNDISADRLTVAAMGADLN
jgi:hypothetical protein